MQHHIVVIDDDDRVRISPEPLVFTVATSRVGQQLAGQLDATPHLMILDAHLLDTLWIESNGRQRQIRAWAARQIAQFPTSAHESQRRLGSRNVVVYHGQ